jgi:hypothetical protein
LAERHRDELGRMLIGAIRVERALGKPKNGERLKVELVNRLEQLAERSLVERPVRLSPPKSSLRNRAVSDPSRSPPANKMPPVPRPPNAPVGRQPTGPAMPALRVPQRSKIHRDGEARQASPPGQTSVQRGLVRPDPTGSSIHRMPVRPPKVVRGDAAAQARPARPRGHSSDDER